MSFSTLPFALIPAHLQHHQLRMSGGFLIPEENVRRITDDIVVDRATGLNCEQVATSLVGNRGLYRLVGPKVKK